MTQKEIQRLERYKRSFLKTIAKHYMTERRIVRERGWEETSLKDFQKIVAIFSEYWDRWVARVTPLESYPILKFAYSDFNGYLQAMEIIKDPYENKYRRIEILYSAMESAVRSAFRCRVNILRKALLSS